MTTEIPALGPVLRRLRRAWTLALAELAALVGRGESHLSRNEAGDCVGRSGALIARSAQALAAPAELARAARALPEECESTVAHAAALGAAFDRRTGPTRRRIDAVAAGELLFASTPNGTRALKDKALYESMPGSAT